MKLLKLNFKGVIILATLSFVIAGGLVIGLRQDAHAALSDGSNVPPTVRWFLGTSCASTGNTVVQNTWISAANNPLLTEVTITTPGQVVNLQYNVVVYRCIAGVPTGIYWTTFRSKFGTYTYNQLPGLGTRSIPEVVDVERVALSPPANGLDFSLEAIPFSIDTSGVTQTSDVTVIVGSKQLNVFSPSNIIGCVVGFDDPPKTVQPFETIEVCPTTQPPNTFRINFNPPPLPDWDVGVDVSCDDLGRAAFTFTKSGTIPTVSVTRSVTKPSGGVGLSGVPATIDNSSFGGGSSVTYYSDSFTLGLGESYSASASVSPGGAGGSNNAANDSDNCSSIQYQASPYVRAYGGDVAVGLPFRDDTGQCTAPKKSSAKIRTYRSTTTQGGSGGQFAVSAANTIEGFMSSGMHSGVGGGDEVPTPITGLSFSNVIGGTSQTGDGAGIDQYGYTGCLPDFIGYARRQNLSPYANQISARTYDKGTTYYVNGNFVIKGNIEYTRNSYTSLQDLQDNPFDVYIVDGDITIEPGVTQLDGLFVASGKINTCGGTGFSLADCRRRLVVNGGFVANKIELGRLNGDVRSAPANEPATSSNIAEVFNYPPELSLMLAKFSSTNTLSNKDKVDVIVGLPPVL